MKYGILLVDDQRDILRLLHSTLDTLKNADLEVFEAPSGEEALLEASRQRIDLLVSDYKLPGMSGIELMHKVRARHPDVKVVLISGMTDRKARDEMLNAGAVALFDKPIPLADFLDVVERSLGLVRTIFPPESGSREEAKRARVSDLLANFRQDMDAHAVFLLNERGMVLARAGALNDSSLEVSLLSALIAIFNAGLKIAKINHQDALNQYFVFGDGDEDLLLIPITGAYALLLAGEKLTQRDSILDTLQALLALRDEVERSLRSMGVTAELKAAPAPPAAPPVKKKGKTGELLPSAPPSPEMEALLKEAARKKVKQQEMDDFWSKAAEQHAGKSSNPEAISYEEARKMGLTPDTQK
ncbi:MAG TPA: response regulator [Anaerolineales bacterium]|nr:response regulator [Anaerolineales bacterium]